MTNTEKDWEKEFDQKFPQLYNGSDVFMVPEIKSFITSLLEEREQILKNKIHSMEDFTGENGRKMVDRDDIISLLTGDKEGVV